MAKKTSMKTVLLCLLLTIGKTGFSQKAKEKKITKGEFLNARLVEEPGPIGSCGANVFRINLRFRVEDIATSEKKDVYVQFTCPAERHGHKYFVVGNYYTLRVTKRPEKDNDSVYEQYDEVVD